LKDKIKKNQIGFISYSWMTTAFYNTIKHNWKIIDKTMSG
jgi:hypothetical protein